MEREVGEIFVCKGKIYKVVEGNTGCLKCCAFCYSTAGGCESPEEITGSCQSFLRKDKKDVHFEEVKDEEL